MYNALPMLTCEHDNYSSFYWILTIVKYVLRGWRNLDQVHRWAIQLKGGGDGGGKENLLSLNLVTFKDRKEIPVSKITLCLC